MKWVVFVVLGLVGACGRDGQDAQDAQPPAVTSPDLVVTAEDGQPVTDLRFSDLLVGQSGLVKVHISNRGDGASGPLALALSGAAANDFHVDDPLTTCAGSELAPGADCVVGVRFVPTTNGDRIATLSVLSAPDGTIVLNLSGHAVTPTLRFVPASIDFGAVEVGEDAQATIQLINDDTAEAPIDSIAVTGAAFASGPHTCGASLAPGASCDIGVQFSAVDVTPRAGALVVTSGGLAYPAPSSGQGARRVTVNQRGTGGGTITSSPVGINCGAACSSLFTSDVMVTATADVGSVFVGWSIPSCGANLTCLVPHGVDPATATAWYALAGTATVDLTFTGDATGEVQIYRTTAGSTLVTTCYASCSVPVQTGDSISLNAATPSTFAGFAGACTSPVEGCSFTVASGTNPITVSFAKGAKEQWVALPFPDETVVAAAYDASGNIIAATMPTTFVAGSHLTKITGAGVTVWTRNIAIRALATGPGDSIYAVSGTNLLKLTATSAVVWSRPLDPNSSTIPFYEPHHLMAVGPSGEVAVYSRGLTVWDSDGNLHWSRPNIGSQAGIAIDANGIIYAGTANPNSEATDARRFMPDGTEVLPPIDRAGMQYDGRFAIDSEGHLVSGTTGHSHAHLTRVDPATGLRDYTLSHRSGGDSYVTNGVATSASGKIAWWDAAEQNADPNQIQVVNNDGSLVWSMSRRGFVVTRGDGYGPAYCDVAYSATGQLLFAGAYRNFYDYQGGSTVAWIQTYQP